MQDKVDENLGTEEENINVKIFVPEQPQTIVALGAAIAVREKLAGKQKSNE